MPNADPAMIRLENQLNQTAYQLEGLLAEMQDFYADGIRPDELNLEFLADLIVQTNEDLVTVAPNCPPFKPELLRLNLLASEIQMLALKFIQPDQLFEAKQRWNLKQERKVRF